MPKKYFYCSAYNKEMEQVYLKRTSKSEACQLQEDIPVAAIGLHQQ